MAIPELRTLTIFGKVGKKLKSKRSSDSNYFRKSRKKVKVRRCRKKLKSKDRGSASRLRESGEKMSRANLAIPELRTLTIFRKVGKKLKSKRSSDSNYFRKSRKKVKVRRCRKKLKSKDRGSASRLRESGEKMSRANLAIPELRTLTIFRKVGKKLKSKDRGSASRLRESDEKISRADLAIPGLWTLTFFDCVLKMAPRFLKNDYYRGDAGAERPTGDFHITTRACVRAPSRPWDAMEGSGRVRPPHIGP